MWISKGYNKRPFKIYNAVPYTGQPAVTGMHPIRVVYESALWGNEDRSVPPSEAKRVALIQSILSSGYTAGPLVLDFEQWNVYGDPVQNGYLATLMQQFKESNPAWLIGNYAIAPKRNHTDALDPITSASYLAWQTLNNAVSNIAALSDMLFPSLYALYPDVDRWKRYAVQNLAEARRYNTTKPIVPFLWPQYHNGMSAEYSLQHIDPEFWYEQLMVCYRQAQGCIIWKNWETPNEAWSQDLAWIEPTQYFMKRYL